MEGCELPPGVSTGLAERSGVRAGSPSVRPGFPDVVSRRLFTVKNSVENFFREVLNRPAHGLDITLTPGEPAAPTSHVIAPRWSRVRSSVTSCAAGR